jgi:penicillin-binding protein 1A
VFILLPVVAFLGLLGTLWYVYANLEIPNAPPGPQTTFVYDRSGKVITTFHAEVNRTEIPLSRMPDHLQHAVISIEDKDFYRHGGVSIVGIVRAAWTNVTHGQVQQGGSTITQQYVKNVYTGSQRTIGRKVKEALLAVKLEHKYSKNEILEKYLNTVYFGNGAYGVEAAAKTYFGVHARELRPLQSATLAAVIAAPAIYDPVKHPDKTKERRNIVLNAMAAQGYLTQSEADQMKRDPVKTRKPKTTSSGRFAYFVDYVRRNLLDKYGEDETYRGGLRVHTTVDSAWQSAAEQAVATHLTDPKGPSAALVAIDPATGAVRALVGGKDFNTAKFNNAIQAHRQAGSAFKTFTLAAAMQQRIDPHAVWQGPPQITIPDRQCYTDGKPWEVHNYADEHSGTMNLIDATANSVNTIFAQVVVDVGPSNVANLAEQMGVRSKLNPFCSITLGSQDVTPMDMANGYATLAARGIHRVPTPLELVRTSSGKTLEKIKSKGDQALAQNDADIVTLALQGVVTHGTGTAAALPGRPAAGKTGTGQNFEDAWFCGYTPQLATCVWVGYPKGEIPMENVEGFAHVFGGSIPALIWHDFMTTAMEGQPVQDFATPSFQGYDVKPNGASILPLPAPSPSPSPSPTPTPSVSPSPEPTITESPSPEPTPTETPSPTPSPTASPEPSPTPTLPNGGTLILRQL